MEEQKTVDEAKPSPTPVVQQVIKTTEAPAAPPRYARGSMGVEEDMPFEAVTRRVKAPRRKRRDSDDSSDDYDNEQDEPSRDSSPEVVKAEPVAEPVQKKAAAPQKKAATKAAPPQKQAAPQPAKTKAAATGKGRTASANERDLQK